MQELGEDLLCPGSESDGALKPFVVKRGDDGKVHPLDVKAGDRILFGKYSGSDIKIDGQEYMIMREDEVLGVIDKQGKKAKA